MILCTIYNICITDFVTPHKAVMISKRDKVQVIAFSGVRKAYYVAKEQLESLSARNEKFRPSN